MKNDDGSGDAPFSVRGLGTAEAAKYLGISASYLEKARVNLTELPGPSFKKIGRRVIYLRESLDAYLNNPPTK